MACKVIFVLSVVVAVLYREMLFTDAQMPGYGANNGAVQIHRQGQMIPGQRIQGQMNPGQMNPGQMITRQMNSGQMIPGQMNPMPGTNGAGFPGQTFPYPNGARQTGARRPSTYDTLSMDVSKQVVGQLTPLAAVGLSAPASYGQAWLMAPETGVRAAQPIFGGALSAANWG